MAVPDPRDEGSEGKIMLHNTKIWAKLDESSTGVSGRRRLPGAGAGTVLLAALGLGAWVPAGAQCVLGGRPPCEASAAVTVDCPDGSGQCLLVGDNEVRTTLFVYRLDRHGRPFGDGQPLGLDLRSKDEISDIEALTATADGRVLALGSHSRNSSCDTKKKRRRIGVIDGLDTQPVKTELHESGKIKCEDLLTSSLRGDPLGAAVCDVLDRTEAAAEAVFEDLENHRIETDEAKERCNGINPYNAEGAVDVGTSGTPDLWIGLRSPLLPAHPADTGKHDLALLLRLHDLDHYDFDRVATLDLDGRGVRDLAIANGTVWLIAGPPQDLGPDDHQPFQLWRFPADDLHGGAVIRPELVRDDLPASSEGLALVEDRAIVVIDGDAGKDNCKGSCKVPSRFLMLEL